MQHSCTPGYTCLFLLSGKEVSVSLPGNGSDEGGAKETEGTSYAEQKVPALEG